MFRQQLQRCGLSARTGGDDRRAEHIAGARPTHAHRSQPPHHAGTIAFFMQRSIVKAIGERYGAGSRADKLCILERVMAGV